MLNANPWLQADVDLFLLARITAGLIDETPPVSPQNRGIRLKRAKAAAQDVRDQSHDGAGYTASLELTCSELRSLHRYVAMLLGEVEDELNQIKAEEREAEKRHA